MRGLIFSAALFSSGVALAVPPLYLPDDVAGARSIGMGDAFRGVGTSNDAIVENPAGLVLNPHYEIAGFFAWDTAAPAAYWNGSIVDATTLPLALGFSYTHVGSGTGDMDSPDYGRYVGSSYRLALAYPISEILAIGINAHWLTYSGDVHTDAVTGDAAIALKLTDQLTISGIGYNLVPVGGASILVPQRFALGASYGTDTTFRADVDVVGTFSSQNTAIDLHAGGEYFLGGVVAVRAGYFYSGLTESNFGSVGVGLVVPGFGADVAYRQSIAPWEDHLFVVDIKFFLSS